MFRAATRGGKNSGTFPAPDGTETPEIHGGTRRGEDSGMFRAATRRGQNSAPEAATPDPVGDSRHGEDSGTFRAARRGENTGTFRAARRGENTGSFRAAGRSETTGTSRVPGRSESTGPHRSDDTGSHRTAARSEDTGAQRTLGKVAEATGSHRIVGKKAPRRKIAGWPIACLVLAALIGLGIVGWNWADSELNSRAEAQAASCSSGTSHMRVIVTPSVQKPLAAAADRWNQAATVVHGQCVNVTIEAKPSAQVLDALVGRANLDSIGGLPTAWLPESTYWISELTTKKPEMIGSPAQSVATARSADYPFVGLTGPGIDDTLLRAAQTFREYLEQPAQQADFTAAGIKTA
ncbi:substrate-binding domain-containing protein [Amycolatopsis sp. WQ 127309]|uniref:substrate-binding domain-containing protein n=1 Tax=Amycolatopsis sp. WQ 127309 TaxID=2932773 RepID=UPI002739649D|nr:substrate-binding domain-containing protein [Amycolatopsis sp. WQ 127309]